MNQDPYNLSIKELCYSNNEEYRQCLRKLMFMKKKEDLHEDLDEVTKDELDFDPENSSKALDFIFEKTESNVYFQALYDSAASKMFSNDRSIGLSVLFSYDYLKHFHNCLIEFIKDPDLFNERSKSYMNMYEKIK